MKIEELNRINERVLKYGMSQKHWACRKDIETLLMALDVAIQSLYKRKSFSFEAQNTLENIERILKLSERRTLGNKL